VSKIGRNTDNDKDVLAEAVWDPLNLSTRVTVDYGFDGGRARQRWSWVVDPEAAAGEVNLVGWSQPSQVVGFRYAKPVLQGLAGRFAPVLVCQDRQSGISAGFWAVLQGLASEAAMVAW